VFLLAFIEKIEAEGRADATALREEFLAAGRKVAKDVLGDQPRIETTWNDENGTIEFRQVLVAVETVREPYRELPLAGLRALGGEIAGITAGEELEVSVLYTSDDDQQARELDAQFDGLLALSCSQRRLWGPLDEALIEVVHRHLPPRVWPVGSAGHLVQSGGWLIGTMGDAGGIAVSIAEGIWKERPSSPDDATIQLGWKLRVERGGRSLDVPVERTEDATSVATWAARAAPETRAHGVRAELARLAVALAGDASVDRLDGPRIVAAIVRILLAEPA